GYFFLKGRADDMIVSAGENVYPSELEHILFQHPFIEYAAVVGVPDEQFGQRLKAVVQLKAGTELNAETLIEWLRPRAARYQMPRETVFVDRIAYTPLGKVDRKQLH
ncbi:AMP-dependent synthetase, partial [Paenibacillus sp. MCAF20]